MSTKVITINPLTRLEGHGKINILLDENGNFDKSFMQVVDLRGFEKFCVGLPAEEMPAVTARICGVCPHCPSSGIIKGAGCPLPRRDPTCGKKTERTVKFGLHGG